MLQLGFDGGAKHITHSHLVRECFIGDEASQWRRPKFEPLNRSSPKLMCMITSWMAPGMQNFVAIGSGVSVPQTRDFAVPLR